MMTIPSTINVPLHQDNDGSIRIGNTRVLLELVVHAFQRGESAESIVESFPTLRLDDVYAVLAYYLQYQDDVHAYIKVVETESQLIREKIEARQPSVKAIRNRLIHHLNKKSS